MNVWYIHYHIKKHAHTLNNIYKFDDNNDKKYTFSYVSNISNKTATKASMVIVFAQYSPM